MSLQLLYFLFLFTNCFLQAEMLFNFVFVWLFNCFEQSVTDEFYVDETRVGVLNYNPGT